jgi:hypothetical protein
MGDDRIETRVANQSLFVGKMIEADWKITHLAMERKREGAAFTTKTLVRR